MMIATRYRRFAMAIALAMVLSLTPASNRSAFADHRAAYDDAAPNVFPDAHAAVEKHRAELMKIPGVSLIYVSNDGDLVVRVRKLTPSLDEQMPKEIDGCRVKVVSVEDVLRRHLHELEAIAGEDQVFSYGVEAFPDGGLAIVVRVRRPDWESPIKVPTNIEGIPLRILIAQDPLTN